MVHQALFSWHTPVAFVCGAVPSWIWCRHNYLKQRKHIADVMALNKKSVQGTNEDIEKTAKIIDKFDSLSKEGVWFLKFWGLSCRKRNRIAFDGPANGSKIDLEKYRER